MYSSVLPLFNVNCDYKIIRKLLKLFLFCLAINQFLLKWHFEYLMDVHQLTLNIQTREYLTQMKNELTCELTIFSDWFLG